MNLAEAELSGYRIRLDPLLDVNETAALVYGAKRGGGRSGVVIFGGGSPKNFMLQTEPQIQEVLKIDEKGHDFFVQVTDARPDTGGLSGATPAEAVSWGKVDPSKLGDTVVAYVDSTIALPIVTSYLLSRRKPRKLKTLYHSRVRLVDDLRSEYQRVQKKLAKRSMGKMKASPN
jgi:deoxyhypusine synthase